MSCSESDPSSPAASSHGDRIRQGHARQRQLAHPPPGRAPYGYRRGQDRYTIDRQAAPMVRAFFERFSLYGSLSDAVRFLDRQYGKRISTTTARRWLANPVYRGDLHYKRADGTEDVIRDTHVPMISRDEAAQIDRRLGRNKQLPPRTASASRSLAGLVSCAVCQSRFRVTSARPYQGKRKKGKSKQGKRQSTVSANSGQASSAQANLADYTYLYPSSCSQQPKCGSLKYGEVLDAAIAQICHDLTQELEHFSALSVKSDVKKSDIKEMKSGEMPTAMDHGFQTEIDRRQRIIDQLPQLEADGILDAETVALRSYNLRVEIAELEQQRQQLPPVNLRETLATLSLPQFWYDLSEVERRFYLREFVRDIEVHRDGDRWWLNLTFAFGAPPKAAAIERGLNPASADISETDDSTDHQNTHHNDKFHDSFGTLNSEPV